MTDLATIIVNAFENQAKARGGLRAHLESAREDIEYARRLQDDAIRDRVLRHAVERITDALNRYSEGNPA